MTIDVIPSSVAVLGAFRTEVERIGGALEGAGPLEAAGPLRYVTGMRGGRKVLAGTTGMGKVRAGAAVQAAVERFRPGLILFVGTAGALSKGVKPLDIVVADRLLEHDTGPKDPRWIAVERCLVDHLEGAARRFCKERSFAVHRGGLISGDRPVLDPGEGAALARRFGALAVDMEAAAAAAVAAANGLVLGAVKAITDSADQNGIRDFKRHLEDAAASVQEVVMFVLGH